MLLKFICAACGFFIYALIYNTKYILILGNKYGDKKVHIPKLLSIFIIKHEMDIYQMQNKDTTKTCIVLSAANIVLYFVYVAFALLTIFVIPYEYETLELCAFLFFLIVYGFSPLAFDVVMSKLFDKKRH